MVPDWEKIRAAVEIGLYRTKYSGLAPGPRTMKRNDMRQAQPTVWTVQAPGIGPLKE
jgi:hypothetical protein